jgi:hypothetical protein
MLIYAKARRIGGSLYILIPATLKRLKDIQENDLIKLRIVDIRRVETTK